MRELTTAEISHVCGGAAIEHQWITSEFDLSRQRSLQAEIRLQMEKVVKELQDSVRVCS